MSAGKREPVTVSFTHISEDVIVPSDLIKWKTNRKKFFGFVLLAFTALPATLVLFLQPDGFVPLFLFAISYLFASLFLTTKLKWIEIDRKHHVINSWTNSKKKRQLPPIKIEDAEIFHKKVGRGNAYATSVFKIFVKASVDGKTIEHVLHHFPDKTDGGIVSSLTSEVSCFINDFLNGKPVKPVDNRYVFVRHP